MTAYAQSGLYAIVWPDSLLAGHNTGGSGKTVVVGMVQFSPYGSPIPIVLQDKFHPENLRT